MTSFPSTHSPRHPLLATTAATATAGLLAALLLALVDGLVAGGGSLRALVLSVSLYAPLGLVLGLALGVVGGGVRAAVPEGSPRLWAYLRAHPPADQAVAAALLAGGACLIVEVALVHLFGMGPAAGMANRRLASLSTALVAGGGVVLCGLAFFPLFAALRLVTRLVPRRATLVVVVLMVGASAAAASLVLGTLDWRVLRFAPWIVLALLVSATALLTYWLVRRDSMAQRLSSLGLAIVVGCGLGLTAPAVGRQVAAVDAALGGGLLLPVLVSAGRALGDRDGDGYSAWFNGGDCDDTNAGVHPGAADIPGNGIDENCEGGDARAGARHPAPATRPAAKGPRFRGNLLIVCIDTLRADKLGAMGHRGGLTPNLDRVAAGGVLFREAVAQGPNTPQSFPSTFTSLYPTRVPFFTTFTGYPRLKPEAVTFFEVLRDKRIRTAAVTSHFYFTEKRGIIQGVDDWDNRDATNLKDSNKDISSPRIVPRAVDKLRALAKDAAPFVLFVHLFEPHSTYMTHAEYPITEKGVKGLEQKYDYEIKFSDAWLGKLLDGLKQAGLEESTALLIYGDHAEAFGEHRRIYFHGQTLYNEVLHVPLVIRLPGGPRRVVTERVALLDIAPTVLDLMGAPVPEAFQGISLLPLVHGGKGPADRRIGAVLMPYPAWPKGWQVMYRGRHKAVYRFTENRFEAYDLERDPREQKDLASDAELARSLRSELTQFAEQELQPRQ